MRNSTLFMLILAMLATSCAKDEGASNAKFNPDQIGFTTSTSRATISTLPILESSASGFVVYATSGTAPAAWFPTINGANNYKYTSGAWGWNSGSPMWPTVATGYPMNFYAYFASSYTGLVLSSPTPAAMTGTYTIQPEATQVDFLSAKAVAISKPASGLLSMTFNHILSKINFGVIPGYETTAYVQSLNANNVGNLRSFNFLAGTWTAAQPTVFTSKYSYKNTTTPALALMGTDASEQTVMNVVPDNNNLMLMPQTATTWTPVSGIAAANAYMGIIYRLTTVADPNAIGYTIANNHPNYGSLPPAIQAALNNAPLFVNVGFPFAPNTMTWNQGYGYTYDICLGTANSSNGYLVSNFYYDQYGNPTALPVIGKNNGDPISNGQIGFIVNVDPWNDQTPGIID